MTRVVELSDYLREVVAALTSQGLTVEQVHPEYAAGQFEVSVAAEDPVGAADTVVLVKETVRAVSVRNGLRASFSPKVLADGVGNGGHVHLSLWRGDANVIAGGDGPFGLTATGQAFTAGILRRLPALMAVGAPSVASYLRLVPSHWAGVFACWGLENREAAVRLVAGPVGATSPGANVEVKCFDLTANPYLAASGLLAAGMAGLDEDATLPDPVDVDPAALDAGERVRRGIHRLPTELADAVAAFDGDEVLRTAFGAELHDTLIAVRRGEIALFADATSAEIVARTRWRY
jgi:glutamine synthetase